jgi:endo-1,4-beta-xylanase
LPAIASAALVALIAAGGVWLYRADILAPVKAPVPVSPQTTLRASADARDFLIGTSANMGAIRGDALYLQTLIHQYNMAVPEGEMRFNRVRPSRTDFNFADADAIVDFAIANRLKLQGYPLIGASAIPDWLSKGNYSPSDVSAMLKDYIQTTVRRYRGRVFSWTVVWGVSDNLGNLDPSFWWKALGDDYIQQALLWAREVDPQVKLFVTDSVLEPLGVKANATYERLRSFRARGIPIDGISVASFFLLTQLPKVQDMAAHLNRLAALGLEVHVSEFEVSVPLPSTADSLQKQAAAYGDYLSACLAIANCKAFMTWGFTDKETYAPRRWPGANVGAAEPFDAGYNPKPAYWAMLDALSGRRSASR